MTDPIPVQLLRDYSREFPHAWRKISRLREQRGKSLPWWPDWCFCPIAASVAVIAEHAEKTDQSVVQLSINYPPGVMAALSAWRITKSIYRFDKTLLNEITAMPMEGNIPSEVYYSLPEWCLFIETPGFTYLKQPVIGCFANLEYDVNTSRPELRIVLVKESMHCIPVPIHLGKWTLKQGIIEFFKESARFRGEEKDPVEYDKESREAVQSIADDVQPFVNLVLYLCSVNADFGSKRPSHPIRKLRKGKVQAATEPRIWDVGVRVGSAIRGAKAEDSKEIGDTGTHASPRPHFRRAHWHHFWKGPRNDPDKRTLTLKWLSPIPVGFKEDETEGPVVVRPVL